MGLLRFGRDDGSFAWLLLWLWWLVGVLGVLGVLFYTPGAWCEV